MSIGRWRQQAEWVIDRVIENNPGLSGTELRKKISQAYPFGQRQNHPYKIWLSVVSNALKPKTCQKRYGPAPQDVPGQMLL